jgi:hypothetical protein
VLLRGGPDSAAKLRRHAERMHRAFRLDGNPLLGVSMFAALDAVAFLDEARDPSIIAPGALVVAGGDDAAAVAVVVDLVAHPNGTIVHLDLLPGSVDDYLELAKRVHSAT